MLGVRFREPLHGGYYLFTSPVDERAADVTLDVEVADVTAFAQTRTATLTGEVTLEGFADRARATGKLALNREQKRVTYNLTFTASDGASCVLRGYRELEVLNLLDSLTMIRASLYDANAREIGRAIVRFDVRAGWKGLLRSVRLVA